MKLLPLPVCLAVLLCAGCGNMLKSKYQRPHIHYPDHWQNETVGTVPAPFIWQDFRDPALNNWLHQVMTRNNDLARAMLRFYRAQLNAERTGILATPDLNIRLNSGAEHELYGSSSWQDKSGTSLSTRYEVDLWGKLARAQDAAEWLSRASEQDLRAARLTLLANASTNYWRIGYLNQQISISQESLEYAKKTRQLASARFHAGKISPLDVVNAEQNVLKQEDRLLTQQYQRQQALNEQTVLLGAPPGKTVVEPGSLSQGPLPQINSGIPVSILSSRPDVNAAEMRLRAALADIDARRTQYYPSFTLTGTLGTSSSALLTFLSNPVAGIGASLTLPFLEWRKMSVDVNIAQNDYEQRALEFTQTLYKAMSDVDNALSLRAQLMAQETHLQTTLALARKSERLNEVRYRQGAVTITDWLNAQEQRRQTESALNENRFNQYQNMAKIYLEFGGEGKDVFLHN
ncbi:TolC family protein [Cedecea sp. NFIX57]|uniref:TolC family protein n=1 Tax=Cedecea sp. NFIX57 TaxID=1566286 RepID=UPI000A0B4108|nr:efflux transporter outer membrane subunit [Cedecea sp. NFIX57]SMG61111.1 efflux transporter, outer membrane factor (OMF) lipoprotein, NodT family [Cedecea sp. NFIX57]